MIAEKNEYLNEASKTIFHMTAEEQIQKRCQDREDYYSDIRSYKKEVARLSDVITEKDIALASLEAKIKELEAQLEQKS